MSLTESLVLSPDVHVIPVAQLPAALRHRLGGDGSGHAVTHPHGRSSSTVVDDSFAELLREFDTPSTVVDAVLRYSIRRAVDAESVLEKAFLPLRKCVEQGYLVPADSPQARRHRDSFAPGERIGDGVVLRCVQALDDTEVYQVARDDGALAALKVLRPNSSPAATAAFDREVRILAELDGRVAPRLLGSGSSADRRWFAMEWCPGVRVTIAAAALRATLEPRERLLDLGTRVTSAYADLHRRGIVHGDVHPGNVIVAPDGEVRLLDFGLARRMNDPSDSPLRGGAPGFLAPDHAAALLAAEIPPTVTETSELYSLGALLYEMFTGTAYVEFAVDHEDTLRQVVGTPPLPFTRRGQAAWPQVESALRAALAKEAVQRPSSAAELGRRLSAARTRPPTSPSTITSGVEALLDTMLTRAAPGGAWYEHGLPTDPLCSIAYGSAGLALALHHVAVLRDDPGVLALSDEWAVRALHRSSDPDAFRSPRLEVTEEIIGKVSPFHRLSGAHATQALISHALGDIGGRQFALDGFVRESTNSSDPFDLTLGRTGTLLGAAILLEALEGHPYADLRDLLELGAMTLDDQWGWIDSLPPVEEATQLRSLGVAHGWAGLLLATLRWCRATSTPPPSATAERLDQLAALAERDGNSLYWPWSTGGSSVMRGWCNGSAGMVHLWTAAHASFGDERWLHLAEGAAWHASDASSDVPQLCCGLAGQAYAQLELYHHTGESHWLALAHHLTATAVAELEAAPTDLCISGSLHKGEVGIATLAADLTRPEYATTPFFGPPC